MTLLFGRLVQILAMPEASVVAADFSGLARSGAAPLSVAFTDRSTGTPTAWHWYKNDGSGWVDFAGTPTVQNPIEVFATGAWAIKLDASNGGGGDVVTKTNYILVSAGGGGNGGNKILLMRTSQ